METEVLPLCWEEFPVRKKTNNFEKKCEDYYNLKQKEVEKNGMRERWKTIKSNNENAYVGAAVQRPTYVKKF